jgi:hypothetical protein
MAKNTSSCSTTVTVVDTTPPRVSCMSVPRHHHHHHHAGNYYKHFLVGPGDASVVARDAAGNSSNAVCPLPAKVHGDQQRHEDRDRK